MRKIITICLYILFLFSAPISPAQTYIITTFAGNGVNGYSGDSGAATNAELAYPWGCVADKYGNIYIADQNNNRIRKVDTNGIITTIGGCGHYAPLGDGGTRY